jgi:hypothetical protein
MEKQRNNLTRSISKFLKMNVFDMFYDYASIKTQTIQIVKNIKKVRVYPLSLFNSVYHYSTTLLHQLHHMFVLSQAH